MLRAQALVFRVNTVIKNAIPLRQLKPAHTIQIARKESIFARYLIATNLTISISASGLGDFIEQMFEIASKYQSKWDATRTSKMAFTGLPVGVICHYFYALLDKYFYHVNLKVIFKKILLCQFVCSPLCIVSFYLTLGHLNNWSYDKIYQYIIEKGSKVFFAEWMVWPPALVFSFYFLSTRYRVLYDNVISLGFDVFNSYLVHKELRDNKK